jgi:hypothetical protein
MPSTAATSTRSSHSCGDDPPSRDGQTRRLVSETVAVADRRVDAAGQGAALTPAGEVLDEDLDRSAHGVGRAPAVKPGRRSLSTTGRTLWLRSSTSSVSTSCCRWSPTPSRGERGAHADGRGVGQARWGTAVIGANHQLPSARAGSPAAVERRAVVRWCHPVEGQLPADSVAVCPLHRVARRRHRVAMELCVVHPETTSRSAQEGLSGGTGTRSRGCVDESEKVLMTAPRAGVTVAAVSDPTSSATVSSERSP